MINCINGDEPGPSLNVNKHTSANTISVKNAGTESVNGFYINMGTHPTDSDGVDYYHNGNLYVYRAIDPEEGKAWIIGDKLGSLLGDDMYYTVLSGKDTPVGLTMTNCIDGVPPGPFIKRYGSVVSIINFLLD